MTEWEEERDGASSGKGKLGKPQHLFAIQGYFYLNFIGSSGKGAFTLFLYLGFLKTWWSHWALGI